MTFSDAWIEADDDDDDFATFLEQHSGAGSLHRLAGRPGSIT